MAVLASVCLGSFACGERTSSAPPPSSASSSTSSAGQGPPGPPGGGWGPHGGYGRLYDPATVETIRGQAVRVEHVTPMRGMSEGVHVLTRIDGGETISVHLGPAWFVENQELVIQPGDTLEVTGSRVTLDGSPALIARTVAKGDEELVLRDEAGFPMWSASRRRQGL